MEMPFCACRAEPAIEQQAQAHAVGPAQGLDVLPLHIQEHLAVLEQCTRNFSDALALVLSAQLSTQHTDQAMKVGNELPQIAATALCLCPKVMRLGHCTSFQGGSTLSTLQSVHADPCPNTHCRKLPLCKLPVRAFHSQGHAYCSHGHSRQCLPCRKKRLGSACVLRRRSSATRQIGCAPLCMDGNQIWLGPARLGGVGSPEGEHALLA